MGPHPQPLRAGQLHLCSPFGGSPHLPFLLIRLCQEKDKKKSKKKKNLSYYNISKTHLYLLLRFLYYLYFILFPALTLNPSSCQCVPRETAKDTAQVCGSLLLRWAVGWDCRLLALTWSSPAVADQYPQLAARKHKHKTLKFLHSPECFARFVILLSVHSLNGRRSHCNASFA